MSAERCKDSVRDGPSMIRGLSRMRDCSNAAVGPHGYCATHARKHGIDVPRTTPSKASFFVTTGNQGEFYIEATSERGVRRIMARDFPTAAILEVRRLP